MIKLELDESRRLTGPNMLWNKPGAILDVLIDGTDKKAVVEEWQNWIVKILPEVRWEDESTIYRVHTHGASMALSAPMDALYTACELAQFAWDMAVASLLDQEAPDWQENIQRLQDELDREINPRLMEVISRAAQEKVTCISDDDFVSLGMGNTADTWEVRYVPHPDDIQWDKYQDIPLALITGTNGKSTSVRLASQIAKVANKTAGVTSTDFIRVGDDIIDYGDYSGPGGARTLVRDPRTEIAYLEVARGGILRRGLPITRVNAALVTNVAADHLGQYGVDTVEELAEAKFVVSKAVDNEGIVVLNADNELVVNQAQRLDCPICWFSESDYNPLIQKQLEVGAPAVFCKDNEIIYFDGQSMVTLCNVADVPMTFGGAARHNVQNALGVVGLSFGLGYSKEDIVAGLKSFASNPKDNPGRGNLYRINNADFIVDFAHNEHSVKAVVEMAKQMDATHYTVMFSHAGDRSDAEIQNLTNAVAGLDADQYITAEVSKYLRGREPGEVPNLSKHYLMLQNIDEDRITYADGPLSGTELAVKNTVPGSVVLLFTLADREEVDAYLRECQ